MSFINTLHYISNPLEEFKDFKFVSWEKEIYPRFKGKTKKSEVKFISDLIVSYNLKNILDLGVGGGMELSGIIETLQNENYTFERTEANEIDDVFITQAQTLFNKTKQSVLIHKSNWLDLPKAEPPYSQIFDFAFLTGNSLTYIGGGSREVTKKMHTNILNKFAQLIKKGGFLFIDSRNYDYIKSLTNHSEKNIFKSFAFDYTIYYHGSSKEIIVFPAYISDTVVVLHYYDMVYKKWSKLDLYPIYQEEMIEILNKDFKIEHIYHDFQEKNEGKSLFVQYLVRRR